MSLPTLSKTWQFNVNQAIAAQGSQQATNRRLLRTLKNSLVGFTSSPWTTRYSCDSTTAGTVGDGVDRWSDDTKLVGNYEGAAHSWYVLRQAGIATSFELLFSCTNSYISTITVAVSPSVGFSGGSTTARPTASDEIVLINSTTWNGNVDLNHKLHVMQSSDGQVTRVMLWENSIMCTFMSFEKPKNPPTGWNNPSTSIALGGGTTQAIFTNLSVNLTAGGGQGYSKGRGTATFGMTWTGETTNSNYLLANGILNSANDFDSSWPFFPIGVASTATSHRGRLGTLFDLWWGSSGTSNADTYPADGSKQFAQLGNLIFPWNGTSPLIV